ncbi:MAG: fused DNA polymerase IV/DNA polymerase III subunit alpha, partial [Chthoniobacterales bacterium]
IRPGAANSLRKDQFARRARGVEPVRYAHPSLEPVLRSTYGVVAYEEHVLQICEVFAGWDAGRADILRRMLVKNRMANVDAWRAEFAAAAQMKGPTDDEIAAVWDLLMQFRGYAFCRAHSTAYGLEAYEAAQLKRYWPAEFLASVLTHGKGFYSRLFYTIEARRLGIWF